MYIARSMTPNPVCIRPEMPLPEAHDLLQGKSFRHLPVTDAEGRLLGMLSDRDIRSAYPSNLLSPPRRSDEVDRLERVTAGAIMSRPPLSLPREATLDDALLLFDRHRVGAIPVTDGAGRVVGIISRRDLMRAYRTLFGIGETGSSLLEVEDDGEPTLICRIVGALEERRISCTRLIRVDPAGDEPGVVYARVQTYNIHAAHEGLAKAGLRVVQHKPAAGP